MTTNSTEPDSISSSGSSRGSGNGAGSGARSRSRPVSRSVEHEYWASLWVEFKRRFVLMAWHNVEMRVLLILSFSVNIVSWICIFIWE